MPSFVTVLIPAYNCEAYVAEAVESALAQDHAAKEVVVVNDGSTDRTLEVLRGFGDRIRVVDQVNSGPPAARNAGLNAARGDYVAFLDADDVWVQGKLAAQARHLDAHADVGTVFTAWRQWHAGADGRFTLGADAASMRVTDEIDPNHSGWSYNRLLFDCELLTTTVMMRRSMIARMGGFDLSLFNGDDYDYWLRASREGRITKLASIGAHYRMVAGSVSRRPQARNFEHEVLQRALDRWGPVGPDGTRSDPAALRRRLATLSYAHGYTHLKRGDPGVAFATLREALAQDPANLKLWMHTVRAAVKATFESGGKTASR